MVLLACTTFLFAGAYLSSLIVPGAVLLGITLLYPPWRAPGAAPPLHRWLIAIAAMVALQLVPLPDFLIDRLSPAARGIWQSLSLTPVRGALPLSVDLTATLRALAIGGGSLLVFVLSRQVFAAGGVRIAVRGVATIGLVLSAISLAQNATAHGLIYWRWDPGEGPPPFGPFLNRNHFATWIVLAVPMCFGYLLAHSAAHRQQEKPYPTWHRRVLRLLDARSIWLTCAICLMLVALVTCLSRSGMIGVAVAAVAGIFLRRRGQSGRSPAVAWAVVAVAMTVIAIAIRIDPGDLVVRFRSAGAAAVYRVGIWQATLPVVQNFWLTGSGAGTLETVMLVSQHTPSLFRINAAHNHYLQVAAEGGLLVGIPVLVALVLLVRESAAALARDDSGMYYLRAGACCGLAGVAVQSIWETGLTSPANGVLAAIVAAVVVHHAAPRARAEAEA